MKRGEGKKNRDRKNGHFLKKMHKDPPRLHFGKGTRVREREKKGERQGRGQQKKNGGTNLEPSTFRGGVWFEFLRKNNREKGNEAPPGR